MENDDGKYVQIYEEAINKIVEIMDSYFFSNNSNIPDEVLEKNREMYEIIDRTKIKVEQIKRKNPYYGRKVVITEELFTQLKESSYTSLDELGYEWSKAERGYISSDKSTIINVFRSPYQRMVKPFINSPLHIENYVMNVDKLISMGFVESF